MATALATATPPAPTQITRPTDAQICASTEAATEAALNANNRVKGFLGVVGEIVPSFPADPVKHVKALTNEELFPIGEKALHDIVDDIIVLDEIRTRFRQAKGCPILGYASFGEFVERNSRYSIRTIQNRLAEVRGKDLTKVNVLTGNQHTRVPEPSIAVEPERAPVVTPAPVIETPVTPAKLIYANGIDFIPEFLTKDEADELFTFMKSQPFDSGDTNLKARISYGPQIYGIRKKNDPKYVWSANIQPEPKVITSLPI
jgi:hypothetical protein